MEEELLVEPNMNPNTSTPQRPAKRKSLARLVMEDVMTAQPTTIGRDQTLETAHRMMREERVRHLPVLEHGQLIGVVSQRDLYFLETIAGVDLREDTVEDAMSVDAYVVKPNDSVVEVATTMAKRKLGCAVVVERDRVVGIFTATDALEVLARAGA
jgi:acetoin utilization protein AcuB